jgi:hypothetical protein
MEATFLLADYAAVAANKLTIVGAGWTRVKANQPFAVGLAAIVRVPWINANEIHSINIRLVTEDGAAVTDDKGTNIDIAGKFEAGRPAGLKPGTELTTPIAINVPVLIVKPGGYRWELAIDGGTVASASFVAFD